MEKLLFVQRLAVNNNFGQLEKIEWVSQITLSKQRISHFKFHYLNILGELGSLLYEFKKRRESVVDNADSFIGAENIFGQDHQLDRLIVIDNVSGLPDKSNDFASFLKVSLKLRYSCIYIFYIFIYIFIFIYIYIFISHLYLSGKVNMEFNLIADKKI